MAFTSNFSGAEIDARLASVDLIYGVKWNQATDTMQKGVIQHGTFIAVDYQSYPIQDNHFRCMRDPVNDTVTYTDPNDSNYYVDGTSVAFDGSEGDMQTQSPAHYQLWTRDGDDIYILISWNPFKFNGDYAVIPPHFMGKSYYYYDCFEGVKYDDGTASLVQGTGTDDFDTANDYLRSLPGYKPWTDQTRAENRSGFANRGGTTHQWSWSAYQTMVALFVTKYGTWNSQAVLPGYTEASNCLLYTSDAADE